MNSGRRSEWAKEFDARTSAIDRLTIDLRDNKPIQEFAEEMEIEIKKLNEAFLSFRKGTGV